MKKNKIFFAFFAILFVASFAMLFNSCNKAKSDNSQAKDLIGTWVNENLEGLDVVVTTSLEFRENGLAHITMVYSNPDSPDDNLDFTLPYEVIGNDMIRFTYNYSDKESDFVEYVDDYFELQGDALILHEATFQDEDGVFLRQK